MGGQSDHFVKMTKHSNCATKKHMYHNCNLYHRRYVNTNKRINISTPSPGGNEPLCMEMMKRSGTLRYFHILPQQKMKAIRTSLYGDRRVVPAGDSAPCLRVDCLDFWRGIV